MKKQNWRRFGHKPLLETLEDRTLLSTTTTGAVQHLLTQGIIGPTAGNSAATPGSPFLLGPKTAASLPTFKPGAIIATAAGKTLIPTDFQGPAGYAPFQLEHAYGYDQLTFDGINTNYNNAGAGQTIAIVDAYDDPNIAGDLQNFDNYFNITGASGNSNDLSFFTKVNQTGGSTPPAASASWALEISLDVEWAHAIAPSANILLVEANSNSFSDLNTAVQYAAGAPDVSEVSMSFAGSEFPGETAYDSVYSQVPGHQGVTFVGATGDDAAPGGYPAASPNVLAAGGTTLVLDNNNNIVSETGWSDSGGGISPYESQPAYQNGVVSAWSTTQRTIPDMSYNADPNTGVSVYDTYGQSGWVQVGGTSASTPQLSATIAIVNQDRTLLGLQTLNTPGSNQTLPELYKLYKASPSDWNDITSGNNGYPATPGYDLVTGLGSPVANKLIPDLATIDTSLAVTSVTPAANTTVTSPPTQFVVTFNDPYNPTTVAANELEVNGIYATSVTQTNATTLTFTFHTSPVTAQGPQSLELPGGQLLRLSDGSPLSAYSETFYYAATPLNVASISPASGSVVVLPTDLIVTFNAAVDPSSINAGNITLSEGTVTGATLLNSKTVEYAVAGIEPDGSTLTVSLAADSLEDRYGNPGPQTSLTATYQVNVPTSAFPELSQLGVAGTLIYSGSGIGNIGFQGDTHTYTLQLDAGQIFSAYVTSDPSLTATIEIKDPTGKVLGSATASSAGALVALSGISVSTAGTYEIIVGGKGSTTGNFTLEAYLNASLQSEQYLSSDIDSTLASAQPLKFASGSTTSSVIGKIPLGVLSGDAFVSTRGPGLELINGSTGAVVATFNDPSFANGTISDVELGPKGDIYVGLDAASPGLDGSGGEIVHFNAGGALVGIIHLPNESVTGYYYYPFGFDVASDGTIWVAGANSGTIIHTDGSGNLLGTYAVGGTPEWTAVRSDGDVYYTDVATSTINLLNPSTGTVTEFAFDPYYSPLGVTINPAGGIIVADPDYGVLQYNAAGNLTGAIEDFNEPIDAQVDPSGNVLAASAAGTLDKYSISGSLIYSTSVGGTPIGLAVVGTDDPAPPTPQTVDYYSLSLKAGQSATVELNTYSGAGASLALIAPDGVTLALGKALDSSDQAINSFIASTAGTYYIEVTGNDSRYDLYVSKDADLDNYANTSIATAQLLVPGSTGTVTVAGDVLAPIANLYAIEWVDGSQQLIHSVDTQTGAFLTTFNSPSTTLTNPYGFNLATDGSYLYFNDGASFGDNTIFKINASTDQVVGSFSVTGAPPLFGLAYLNGYLYGTDANNIYKIDPNTGTVLSEFAPGLDGNVTGIAGDPSRGVLWAVSQYHTLFEIDVATQSVIATAPDGLSLYEQDIGYQNNEIYVSETDGTTSDIAVFSASTLQLERDLPVTATTLSGLGADGVTSQTSYYRLDAKAGNKLTISTTTPYGDPQFPYQPDNTLVPIINLYDANGNLLATNQGGASDGKNALINFTVPTTGNYYVQVLSSNGSSGEYTLSVKGATGALPAFTVADTNPPSGAHVPPLSSITVDFSDSILLSSLPTAKVTFGGKVATGYTVDNDHEVTWNLQSLPGGLNVPYTFKIAAGAVTDIQGVALSAFTETIIVNTVPPEVVSTSIANGAVKSPGDITYKVTFNEPINTADFSQYSFQLLGVYRGVDYTPTSYSFNSAGTVLTISYASVPDDAYTLTLYSSGIEDLTGYNLDGLDTGVPGSGDYVGTFDLNVSKTAFPSLTSVAPYGSLIYQGSTTGVIAPAGESDTYTLKLAKNQSVTIDLTTDGNLQGAVALYDPSGNLVDSWTAAAAGGEVVLQTDPAVSSGTYSIVVSGYNGTQGLYTVQVTLNAALELADHGGGSDNTIATAQAIDGAFVGLGGTASRAAVIGENNTASIYPGDVFVSARYGDPVSLVHDGVVVATFSDSSLYNGVVQDIKIGPDGNIYVGLDADPGNGDGGEVLEFTPSGTLVTTIDLPNDSPNGYYYPFGFDIASDGSIWVAAPNSGEIIHAGANGALIARYAVGGLPEWVAIQPSTGNVFYSDDANSAVDVLNPTTGTTSPFAADPYGAPFGIRFTPAGNLLLADPDFGAIEYGSNGNVLLSVSDYGAIESQVNQAGDILIANASFDTLDQFDPNGNYLGSAYINGEPIGLAVEGIDGPAPPPPAPTYYSFKLDAGQTATAVLTDLTSGTTTETLLNGSGNVLATGTTVNTNIGQTLSFTATTAGTYYIAVSGAGVEYDLVVTKNAAFDTEANDTQSLAQPLPAGNVALGAVDTSTDVDFYAFAGKAGDKLKITATAPGSSSGAQFINNLTPTVDLYNSSGTLVASGTATASYKIPAGAAGTYYVSVSGQSGSIGEYVLQVTGATGAPLPSVILQPTGSVLVAQSQASTSSNSQVAIAAFSYGAGRESANTVNGEPNVGTPSVTSTLGSSSSVSVAPTGDTGGTTPGSLAASDVLFTQLNRNASDEDLLTTLAYHLVPTTGGTDSSGS